jgi:hypothetical protein
MARLRFGGHVERLISRSEIVMTMTRCTKHAFGIGPKMRGVHYPERAHSPKYPFESEPTLVQNEI